MFPLGWFQKPKRRKRKDKTVSIRSANTDRSAKTDKSANPSIQSQPEPEPEKPKQPGVKADPDYFLPSDSDDEAPSGGYYIVEGKEHPEPTESTPSIPPPQASRSKSPIPVEPSLIRPKYVRPPPKKVPEDMALSDSDDEPPPGGYQVKEGTWESNRDKLLGRSPQAQLAGNGTRRNSMPTNTKKVEKEKFKVVNNAPRQANKDAT
jgi:hypothetical protein